MTIVALLLCVCALVALVTVVLLVTSYAYFCINWRKVRHIPGPRPVWPIGNAGLLRVDGESITFLEAYDKLAKEYGDVFVFWMGCTPNVVTVSASPREPALLLTAFFLARFLRALSACCPRAALTALPSASRVRL